MASQAGGTDVVYFCARVAVVHDLTWKTQRLFAGHDDDIKSMAFHLKSDMVATGQVRLFHKHPPRAFLRANNNPPSQQLGPHRAFSRQAQSVFQSRRRELFLVVCVAYRVSIGTVCVALRNASPDATLAGGQGRHRVRVVRTNVHRGGAAADGRAALGGGARLLAVRRQPRDGRRRHAPHGVCVNSTQACVLILPRLCVDPTQVCVIPTQVCFNPTQVCIDPT